MVNIFDDLAGVGFPAYQQGTAPATLPETFVTVWEDPSSDILHADNKPRQLRREWTLIFYTKDAQKIFSGLLSVKSFLKTKGYTINGNGYDVGGAWEGYDARGLDVVKLEDLEE